MNHQNQNSTERVVSKTHGHVRAGMRVRILQVEGKSARVRVISVGWNQFEVYNLPRTIVGL
jgi:hypothetical protein